MSTENRPPPAFQEYAASRLADRVFKSMSAIERGCFYTMRLECWANGYLPAQKYDLARVLGLREEEVDQGLTSRVLSHFMERQSQDGAVLICPELEDYRRMLQERRSKQSAGGKQTASLINAHRQADRRADRLADSSSVQTNEEKSKSVSNNALEHKEFLAELSGTPEFMTPRKAKGAH